jgi:integrase
MTLPAARDGGRKDGRTEAEPRPDGWTAARPAAHRCARREAPRRRRPSRASAVPLCSGLGVGCALSPPGVVTPRGRQFTKSSHLYYWRAVRTGFGRPAMDFYELRHFCATHLLELGVSHADVAVQLGHTDGGALVMSTYGHPSEDAAREPLKRAYSANVRPLAPVRDGSQERSSSG